MKSTKYFIDKHGNYLEVEILCLVGAGYKVRDINTGQEFITNAKSLMDTPEDKEGKNIYVNDYVMHEDHSILKVLGFANIEDGEVLIRVETVDGDVPWSLVRNYSVTKMLNTKTIKEEEEEKEEETIEDETLGTPEVTIEVGDFVIYTYNDDNGVGYGTVEVVNKDNQQVCILDRRNHGLVVIPSYDVIPKYKIRTLL